MREGQQIMVRSLAYDGSERKSWPGTLVRLDETFIEVTGEFESDVSHPDLGLIRRGTTSREYFWLNRWYNVFRFHEPDGGLRNYYYNISMPPKLEDAQLKYIDLDIDVVVWPDGSFTVLDIKEFETNAAGFPYPQSIIENVWQTLDEITTLVKAGLF